VEHGATRNFDPWKAEANENAEEVRKRADEEDGDAMKALENRTLDSKREMDIMDALDELKSLKARQAKLDSEALFESRRRIAAEARSRHKDLTEAERDELQAFTAARASGRVRHLSDEEGEANAAACEGAHDAAAPAARKIGKLSSSKRTSTLNEDNDDELSGVSAGLLAVLGPEKDEEDVVRRPPKRARMLNVVAVKKVDMPAAKKPQKNTEEQEVAAVNPLGNLLGYGSSDSD
jgi:Saf4/Yju2 protein